MPVYIMLTKLTDDGRETLKKKPHRLKEVNQEVEAMGVKILPQYALLGPYDFTSILEAPDNNTITRVSIELGSRGTLIPTTFPAMDIDELIKALETEEDEEEEDD